MSFQDKRIEEIMELLMSYARLEFDHKIQIDSHQDELTAISAGVNMLGEELKVNFISLKEKERLLKELHHRVKNNMQIITSMLRLQTMNEDDPKILSFVRDSKSRIESMALVHEMLYSSEGFEYTQFSEYVDFLQRSIFMSYAPPKHKIEVDVKVNEKCYFNIDKMIPLGLILNELFTNSLKHAFESNEGLISLQAQNIGERGFVIVYEDNGVGLPANFDLSTSTTLGMQLIEMLSEQIDGKIDFSFSGKQSGKGYGLRFELRL
ncbi:MAG: two-component sensor histidine kinase [Arenicella sp.]|jgi:two-component sensor histidine kinase